jgi:1,2-diacylglycerol 3-alpha-glucosyltransferase
MKKLNILIVCDSAIGGTSVSPLRFARLLTKRGHKVIFLAAKLPGKPKTDSKDGISFIRPRSILIPNFEKTLGVSFPMIKEIKKILTKEKIDIIHIMVPSFASIISIIAAKNQLVPITSHSHTQPEIFSIKLPRVFQRKLIIKSLRKLIYLYLVKLYNHTNMIIAPSNLSKKLLLENKIKSKSVVISNGVDLAHFKKVNPKEFIKKYKLDPEDKRILYVGRLHPEKSLDTLIKSIPNILKKYKNFHIDIIGHGYLKETLEKLAVKLKAKNKITFFGKVSEEDLVQAYNACDIFVLPSLAELEGMVVLEAMACGKPIVIANSEDSASVDFVDGNGFLFKPENPTDLSGKILKLLKNDNLRKRMGEKSYEIAKDYDINESINKLENVYYNIIKDNKNLKVI